MNYWLVPTLLLALGLFGLGIALERKLKRPWLFNQWAALGLLAVHI